MTDWRARKKLQIVDLCRAVHCSMHPPSAQFLLVPLWYKALVRYTTDCGRVLPSAAGRRGNKRFTCISPVADNPLPHHLGYSHTPTRQTTD